MIQRTTKGATRSFRNLRSFFRAVNAENPGTVEAYERTTDGGAIVEVRAGDGALWRVRYASATVMEIYLRRRLTNPTTIAIENKNC